jgi:hypothetical protein
MLQKFFEAVLPRTGNYCLFRSDTKQHLWASSIEQLVEKVQANTDRHGIYFGTASYTTTDNRTQANVLALRALRLDIDAGFKKHTADPENTYPTQQDAIRALMRFTKDTGLQPSYVVSSGEGLHVYYCLDRDVQPADWGALARGLGGLASAQGLKTDRKVTTDTARILRPPSTLHPNASRVKVLASSGEAYSPDDLARFIPVDQASEVERRHYDTSINADVAVEGPPKSVLKIREHCGAMAEAMAKRGDVPEPYWRAMLGIVKYTVEGDEAAHELSNGYAGYDWEETQKKIDRWNTGPTTCAEFSNHTKACTTCPHNGRIKSPIVLGYLSEEKVAELPPEHQPAAPVQQPTGDPWDGCLPEGYLVRKDGNKLTLLALVQVEKEDETGEKVKMMVTVPMTHRVFWLAHWAEAVTDEDSAQAVMNVWDAKLKQVRIYTMPQALSANRFKLLEYLADKGITITNHAKASKAVEDYVRDEFHRIAAMSRRPKVNDRFGMRIMPDGTLACAHGRYVIQSDGTIQEAMLGHALREQADKFHIAAMPDSPSGDWPATVWDDWIIPRAKQHADFFNKHYGRAGLGKYQLAIMLGLASPLMPFVMGSYHAGVKLPPNGLSVSLYSREGGRGKTTLIQSIMLAYGNGHELTTDAGVNGSTDVARLVKLSMWGTMPMSMEEMGGAKEQSVTALISSVANGTGRTIGTRTGGMKQSAPWALINFITTNRAQRDMVASTTEESSAIQYRMLELNVDGVTFSEDERSSHATDFAVLQRDCAGALGAYVEYLMCRYGPEDLNRGVMMAVDKASKAIGAAQDARFQYRALGALLFVHKVLAREGIKIFELQDLIDEFKLAHDAGVTYVQENILPSDGIALAGLMLNDFKPHTLVTADETNRSLNPTKYDIPLNERVPEIVKARHVSQMGYTYVSANAVREWSIAKKISERDLLKDCQGAGLLLPIAPGGSRLTGPVDLFKGMKDSADSRYTAYKFNTRRLKQLLGGDWEEASAGSNVVPLVKPADPSAQPQEQTA